MNPSNGRRTPSPGTGTGIWPPAPSTEFAESWESPGQTLTRHRPKPPRSSGAAAPAGEEVSRRRRRPEEAPLEPRNTQLLVDAVDRFWSRFWNPAPPAPPLTGIRFHGNAVPSVGGAGDEPEMTGLVRTTLIPLPGHKLRPVNLGGVSCAGEGWLASMALRL